jgi:hypothetical protein
MSRCTYFHRNTSIDVSTTKIGTDLLVDVGIEGENKGKKGEKLFVIVHHSAETTPLIRSTLKFAE